MGDRIVLKQGNVLTGEILSIKPDKLYLDIGIDVLAIDRSEILEYEQGEASDVEDSAGDDANDATVAADQPEARDPNSYSLYKTSELKIKTIAQCVELVSESVVKIVSPGGSGSGFFINEEGYLVTNYHVIERETRIEVIVFRKGRTGFERTTFKKVRIVAMNQFVDLALLKVEDLGDYKVRTVYLGDIDRLKAGQYVFAIGNPLGLERTITNGVISTKSRAFEGLVYLQTNADINPGNSGGPLFSLTGEVVGVINMGYISYGGLGFAIPVDYVKHFLDNREAFAYDKDNPNTGYRYIQPDPRRNHNDPKDLLGVGKENTAK
jgi:serine protease Do